MQAHATGAHDLLEALAVEQIEEQLYRANFVQVEDYPLFGGQVAAQALAAAGATVPAERVPHSLHGYYLRRGEAHRPTLLQIECDRDGRSFSARRVIAIQQGKVIFNMAVSFHEAAADAVDQRLPAPQLGSPEDLTDASMRRYPAIEVRAEPRPSGQVLPDRFWARVRHGMPADLLSHACALTYISDMSTGLVQLLPDVIPAASLDHALWIHQVPRTDQWLLVDLTGLALAGSRGHYSGSIFTKDGRLVASLAQEMVIRR
jgi:acyl-CoA thioesterase II